MASSDFVIRPARPEDCAAISAIARRAYARYVGRIGKEPAPMIANFAAHIAAGEAWAGEVRGEVIGYAVFSERGDHVHLENIAVDPVHAERGYGGQLIAFVENAARDAGKVAVELYTNEKMTENLALYPALDFVETGRRKEDGFRRVYFRKSI